MESMKKIKKYSIFLSQNHLLHDQTATASNKSTTTTGLSNVDDYTLMELIDHLEFDDILKLADLSTELRAIITERYMVPIYQLHEKTICFTVGMDEHQPGSRLVINELPVALRLLRIFGHLVTKLKLFSLNFTTEQLTLIGNYIAKYCQSSLIELELFGIQTSELITDPTNLFPNVTKLKLSSFHPMGSLEIHKIYPALKELTYSCHAFSRNSHIFPNLVRFELIENGVDANDSNIREFLKLNSHLRELSLSRIVTFDLMKFMEENLEKLESLEIGYLSHAMQSPNNEILHFGDIRSFVITPKARGNILQKFPLSFNRLDSVEIRTNDYFNVPLNLIKENPMIKTLSLPWLDGRQAVRVLSGVRDSHQLEEATVKLTNIDSMPEVLESINEFGAMRRINFIVHDLVGETSSRRAVLTNIPARWHLDEFKVVEKGLVDVIHIVLSRIK